MGNNQSQSSDDDETVPSYKYHEDVLKNAELHTTQERQHQRRLPVYESENEEYFSADEGDSERSITPLRTRPESSSSEDISDDSFDEDVENIAGSGKESPQPNAEIATVSTYSSIPVPSSEKSVLSRKKSYKQCNASRFEEHDSITPELETSRWHLSDSSATQNSPGNESQNLSLSHKNSMTGRRLEAQSVSPFIPIHSPPNPVNVSLLGSSHVHQRALRQKSSCSSGIDEICIPPKKRNHTETNPWKRGFGFYDSSDSDDAVVETVMRQSHSSRSRSPKRAKLSVGLETPGSKRYSTEYEKQKMDSVHSSPKHRRVLDKQAVQTVKSNSVKRSHSNEWHEKESSAKRVRGKIPVVILSQQGDCEDSGPRDMPQNHNVEIDEETDDRLVTDVFQCDANEVDPKSIDGKKNDSRDSSKMGANAVRNSHGKLLPVREYSNNNQSEVNNLDKKNGSHLEDGQAFSSSLTNITDKLRRPKRVMESSSSDNQMKRKSAPAREESLSEASPKKLRDSSTLQSSYSDINPLANVVLSPPNVQTSRSDNHLNSSSAMHSSHKEKIKCAAERFKTFWMEGSLGTNFKSLFLTKRKFEDKNSIGTEASPSLSKSATSLPGKHLFHDSNHFCFSSSPDDLSQSRSLRSKSFSTHKISPDSQNLSLNSKISISPIFASMPAKSVSDISMNFNTSPKYSSSCLEMSVNTRRKGTQQKKIYHSRMPTRTSPRLHSSSARPESVPNKSPTPPPRDEIEHLPRTSQLQVLHFKIADILEVSVSMGEIADEVSAGIVNWTDPSLTHCVTKCSQRIASKAGALMRAGCSDYLTNKGAVLEAPDVLTTPAGGRFPKSVEALLHVVTPQLERRDKHINSMTTRLLEVYANCLRFANERLGLQSLSLPLIGQDLFNNEVSIRAFINAVLVFIAEAQMKTSKSSTQNSFDLTFVNLVLEDAPTTDLAAEVISDVLLHVAAYGMQAVARNVVEICDNNVSDSDSHSDMSIVEMEESPDTNNSNDRAISGRPRVKRPKL